MNTKRPVNLDLGKLHFPLPAIISILHRISGIIVFIGMAILLFLLDRSLSGESGFNSVASLLDNPLAKLILWGILAGLAYHLIAGVKHLIADFGIGEELASARLAAKATVVISVIVIVLLGVWIW
ncbi:MAG: succinate dehydrogenase, cytochrome b556 subunit [Halomonadaceae bacterium]|nr:MAG: succinate dehydrogenase, cytochrome b556 subunit [Halomonadaceae bacterium]